MDSPRKGQWRGALIFSLICAWTNGWVKIVMLVELRCHRANNDVTYNVMTSHTKPLQWLHIWFDLISVSIKCHIYNNIPHSQNPGKQYHALRKYNNISYVYQTLCVRQFTLIGWKVSNESTDTARHNIIYVFERISFTIKKLRECSSGGYFWVAIPGGCFDI